MIKVEVCKKLDEEVAELMVAGFGGTVTKLTDEQAKYINVDIDGPFMMIHINIDIYFSNL